MSEDVLALSCEALLSAFRTKTLSPVEVTRATLDRIELLQPAFNAFAFVGAEQALADARASERRWMAGAPIGRVDGLPTTVKDLLLCRDWPTRRGSLTTDAAGPWPDDSASVARLREQGAVFLGKTTTPEFGWKGVTDSPLTGITRNPWNPSLTPGGTHSNLTHPSYLMNECRWLFACRSMRLRSSPWRTPCCMSASFMPCCRSRWWW